MNGMLGLVAGALMLMRLAPAHADPPKLPNGILRITIDHTWYGEFGHDEHHYVLTWNLAGHYVGKDVQSVPVASVAALVGALTDLEPSDADVSCQTGIPGANTSFTVTLYGEPSITLRSRSVCDDNIPWNVVIGDKRSYQLTGAIGRQLYALLEQMDPQTWKSPMRSLDGPQVLVFPGASPASACAHDLETAKQFGSAVRVQHAAIACAADKGNDCATRLLHATVTWSGVDVPLEMPCADGHAAPPPAVIAELRPILESKVVRAVVSTSGWTPSIRATGDAWVVQTTHKGATTLRYDRKTKRVTIWSDAQALWNALGVKPASGWTFTLDGKRVK